MKKRILFVCLGNICRSPAAEGIMNHLLQQRNLQDHITCDSAGTIGYHQGNQPDPRMTETLQAADIPMHSRARKIEASDLQQFDLILTMDEENQNNVLALCQGDAERSKVLPITQFCQKHDHAVEVPDPYYGGAAGFTYVKELLLDACQGVIESVTDQDAWACGEVSARI